MPTDEDETRGRMNGELEITVTSGEAFDDTITKKATPGEFGYEVKSPANSVAWSGSPIGQKGITFLAEEGTIRLPRELGPFQVVITRGGQIRIQSADAAKRDADDGEAAEACSAPSPMKLTLER